MTTIEDTLTYIDGSKANGRLVVGWKPFTVGNVNAAGGELEWQIVEGAVSISLYANTGAQPTGSYYVVKYELENGAVYLEQWIVPDLPTVNLGQVRVAFPPSPSVMISPLQLTSLGAAPGMFLMWNGQRWVPGYPGTFSFVDPTLVKGDMIVRGDVAPATRLGVGTDGLVLTANSSQPLGVSWTLVGGASSQTPWVVDIDGAGHKLKNAGNIGIGNDATGLAFAGYPQLIVGPAIAAVQCGLVLACGNASTGAAAVGSFAGVNWAVATTDKRIAEMRIDTDTASNSGAFSFNTWNAGVVGEKMRITAAGNVGIGTTTPNKPLEVFNAAATTVDAVFGNASGAIALIANGNVGGVQGYTSTAAVSSANITLQSGGGNVGIGTTGPASTLTVIPAATPTTIATANQIAVGEPSNNAGYRLSMGWGVISSINCGVIQALGGGIGCVLALNPSGGNVGIGTTGPSVLLSTGAAVAPIKIAVFDQGTGLNCYGIGIGSGMLTFGAAISVTSGIPQMVLTSAGNVGIGTTGPTASMHLARGDGSYHLKLLANGIREYGLAVTGAGFLTLDDVTGGAIRMMINPSGNIGIGGSPGYKLDVAGDVNTSGVFRSSGIPVAQIASRLDAGSPAFGTVFQNSFGKPTFVSITATINSLSYIKLISDAGNPPTATVCSTTNAAGGGTTIGGTVSGWIMPGHYYKVDSGGATLISWYVFN